MYESPHELIADIGFQRLISCSTLTRVAGVSFILSLVVPLFIDTLGYATFVTGSGRSVVFNYPYNPQLTVVAAEGVVAPANMAVDQGLAAGGALMLARLFFPGFLFALPIVAGVLTVLPIPIGAILIAGYTRRPTLIAGIYLAALFAYSLMLGLAGVTTNASVGMIFAAIGALILLMIGGDRKQSLGIITNNS
jgi:hypothetical protein